MEGDQKLAIAKVLCASSL